MMVSLEKKPANGGNPAFAQAPKKRAFKKAVNLGMARGDKGATIADRFKMVRDAGFDGIEVGDTGGICLRRRRFEARHTLHPPNIQQPPQFRQAVADQDSVAQRPDIRPCLVTHPDPSSERHLPSSPA